MIELMLPKELMVIKQANQNFFNKGFNFQPYIYNRCYDLLMMSMNLSKIAILKVKKAIIKFDLKNRNFTNKKELFQ